MTTEIELCPLSRHHLEGAAALSAAAGWPHRVDDWEMMLGLSQGIVALSGGHVVGTACSTDFGPALSCVNMILVDEAHRGQGLGRRLTSQVLDGTGQRGFKLVATPMGEPVYRKLGFEKTRGIVQMQGHAHPLPEMPGATDATRSDLADILHLDTHGFGGDRTGLIEWLFTNGHVSVLRSRNGVLGFAGMRQFGQGFVIGPVVAPSKDQAKTLISHLARRVPGAFVRVDVTDASGLEDWLSDLGLAVAHRPSVMQRDDTHAVPDYIALFSQAFG